MKGSFWKINHNIKIFVDGNAMWNKGIMKKIYYVDKALKKYLLETTYFL